MIYDIILIIIVIVSVVVSAWRGAARSLAGIATSIAAYFLSTVFGAFLAEKIYVMFLQPAVDKAVANAITNVSSDAAVSAVESLPSWLTGMLNLSGEDLTEVFSKPLSSASDSITTAIDSAVKPIAVGILSFFITILLFFIFSWIIRKLLIKPLLKIFDFPVIRTVNKLLGAVVGLAYAFLAVSMIGYLLHLVIPYVGSESGWFNESTIYNSFIFYHFYNDNIFSAVSSLFFE